MTPALDRPAKDRAVRLAAPVLLLIALGVLFAWTWQASTDELVDAGRELYLAWRISEGDVLYQDLYYEYGPLSPYLNGLVFKAFGPGIRTLLLWNLVLIGAVLALSYHVLSGLGGRFAAVLGGFSFLSLFAFRLFEEDVALFNYLGPYSHTMTHGVLIGLGALAVLAAYHRRPRAGPAAAAGLAASLAFLTKPEVSLAVTASVAAGLTASWWYHRPAWRQISTHLAAAVGSATLTLAVTWLLLATALSWGSALDGLFGAWLPLLDPAHMSAHLQVFSLRGLGLDAPIRNLLRLLVSLGCYSVVIGPAALLARQLANSPRNRRFGGLAAFALVSGIGLWISEGWGHEEWFLAGAPLTWFCLGALLLVLIRLRRSKREQDTQAAQRAAGMLSLLALGLGLLAKAGLSARIFDYGFVLAMPAFLAAVVALVSWWPQAMERRGRCGWVLRATISGLLLVLFVGHLGLTSQRLSVRTHPLGQGRDAILTGSRGMVLSSALDAVLRHVPPDGDLLVLPEGVMVNYLSRRTSSSPHMSFIPPQVARFGEDRMLEQFARRPPGHVLLIHRETGEFGPRMFGHDYGEELRAWITANYHPVARIGAEPFTGNAGGAVLLAPNRSVDGAGSIPAESKIHETR